MHKSAVKRKSNNQTTANPDQEMSKKKATEEPLTLRLSTEAPEPEKTSVSTEKKKAQETVKPAETQAEKTNPSRIEMPTTEPVLNLEGTETGVEEAARQMSKNIQMPAEEKPEDAALDLSDFSTDSIEEEAEKLNISHSHMRSMDATSVTAIDLTRPKMDAAEDTAESVEKQLNRPDVYNTEREQPDILTDIAEQILNNVISGKPLEEVGLCSGFDLSEEEVLQLIQPSLNRLALQLDRSIAKLQSNSGHQETISNIYASGTLSCQQGIAQNLEQHIFNSDAEIHPLPLGEKSDDPEFQKLTDLERDAYMPAVGMALSEMGKTPNFLFTYKDRWIENILKWTSRGILTVLGCIFLVTAAGWYGDYTTQQQHEKQIHRLQRQLDSAPLLLSQSVLEQQLQQRLKYQKNIQRFAQKLAPLAILNEVSGLTPSYVGLINLRLSGDTPREIFIDATVMAKESILESRLVEYLLLLGKHPYFQRPVILNKQSEKYRGKPRLRVTLKAKLNL